MAYTQVYATGRQAGRSCRQALLACHSVQGSTGSAASLAQTGSDGHAKESEADLLEILEHPNPDRYAGQRIFVVQRDDDVYLVPFVEDEHTVFLKTIIPSRKATKEYLGEEPDDET